MISLRILTILVTIFLNILIVNSQQVGNKFSHHVKIIQKELITNKLDHITNKNEDIDKQQEFSNTIGIIYYNSEQTFYKHIKENNFKNSIITAIDENDKIIHSNILYKKENNSKYFEYPVYNIHLNEKGKIWHLDFSTGITSKSKFSNNIPYNISYPKVILNRYKQGAIPVLKEPYKVVEGKFEKIEPEKTFIQKYWIYIIPLLIMFVSSSVQQ